MTATCPTNTPAKMNSPQSVVPQNFQIRGGRCGSGTAGGTSAGLAGFVAGFSESIKWLSRCRRDRPCSRQRTLEQPLCVIVGEFDCAVHAGVIPGKARHGEQFGMVWRHRIE